MIVGTKDLEKNLTRYLRNVREGESITVTRYGKPVAQLRPIGEPSGLEKLIAEGRATPAKRTKHPAPSPLRIDGSIMDLIKEQRG